MAPIKLQLDNADLEREEKRVHNPAPGKDNGQSKSSASPLITDSHLRRSSGDERRGGGVGGCREGVCSGIGTWRGSARRREVRFQ